MPILAVGYLEKQNRTLNMKSMREYFSKRRGFGRVIQGNLLDSRGIQQ